MEGKVRCLSCFEENHRLFEGLDEAVASNCDGPQRTSHSPLLTRLSLQKARHLTSLREVIIRVEGLDVCYCREGMKCRRKLPIP